MRLSVTKAKAALEKAKTDHGHSSPEAQQAKKTLRETRDAVLRARKRGGRR